MNSVAIMGRLVAEPELKTTQQSGVSVTSFAVAVPRSYVKPGEERQSDFIDCVAWRSTAEFICRYFVKGQLIALTGEIQTRKYTDKNGNKRKATELLVDKAHFTGDNRSSSSQAPASQAGGDYEEFTDIEDDQDLPF